MSLLLGIVGIGVLSDLVDADSTPANGQGTLTVGGDSYTFTPTACFVSDQDFVAAGTGVRDGDQFWVSATSVSLDLAVGTDSEADRPADDQLWLVSVDVNRWRATDQGVEAEATMSDTRDPESPTFLGTLDVQCGTDI